MLNYTNHVREKIRNNEKVAAAWAQAGSNITAEIMAEAGFDMLIIDHEHGPGDIQSLISQIQALKGEKTVPFARAPWNDFVQIKRILDMKMEIQIILLNLLQLPLLLSLKALAL